MRPQLPFEAPSALGLHDHMFVNGGSVQNPLLSQRPAQALNACAQYWPFSECRVVRPQLPFEAPRALGLHGHVFVNGGSVELLTGTGRTLRQGASDFLRSFRWSAVRSALHTTTDILWLLLCLKCNSMEGVAAFACGNCRMHSTIVACHACHMQRTAGLLWVQTCPILGTCRAWGSCGRQISACWR